MKTFSQLWAHWILRQRKWVLIAFAAMIALAPLSFDRLYHDDSNESYFLEHDPNLKAFNQLIDLFGDNEYLLVGIPARQQDRDVFTAPTINLVNDLTQFLENHRHVTQVRSLSKYEYTHDDDGLLATDELFEDMAGLDAEALNHAREVMKNEDLALGSLITADLKHTVIAARTTYLRGENDHKVEVVNELRAFIDEHNYKAEGYQLHLSGIPVIGERFATLTKRDMAWINPVMAVIMVTILLIIFRSLAATMVPMLLIGSTVLLTISIQAWLGWPFTAVNSALIPTVIVLSVGTSIHVLVDFYRIRNQGLSPYDAAQAAVADLLFPIFFTCLTTALGFITLAITELAPVRQFALLAATAAMLIFLLAMSALPAALSFIPWIAKGRSQNKDHLIHQFLQWLPSFVYKHRKGTAILGLSIALFSLVGIRFISVDTNIINYFKKDAWVSQDLHYFNEQFQGIANLEFIIDSGETGGIHQPNFLQRVDSLQNHLEQLGSSGKAISLIRFHKQINQSLNEDKAEFYALPTSANMAAQFLLLYENTGPDEDLSDLKDFDERYLRLSIPFRNMDARDMTAELGSIKKHLAAEFSDLNMEITGGMVMNNAQNTYVNNGMLASFGMAILMIGLSFILLFRSFKYGLIALIPSIVPVLLTGGLVSLAGISLDLGTMIVGAMTIGIAVDDSIHLMSRYLLQRKKGEAVLPAISAALATTGKAVILTSIILVCGFSVMLLGSFVSYIYVGLFSAMIMSFALIGDLFFMPALLLIFDRKALQSRSNKHQQEASHA